MSIRPLLAASVWLFATWLPPASFAEETVEEPVRTESALEGSGVSVQTVCTNCNNADLSLSGLGNDHVPLTCDGLAIPPGLGQVYRLSVMPATAIDTVTVKRGAGDAATEAAAIGGAIAIGRREPRRGLQLFASGDSGSFGWGGGRMDVSGGSERFSGALRAAWAQSDAIDSNEDDGFEYHSLGAFARRTFDGGFKWRIAPGHTLDLTGAHYDENQRDASGGYDYLNYFITQAMTGTGEDYFRREDVDLEREEYTATYELAMQGGSRLSVGGLWADRREEILEEFSRNQPTVPSYDIGERATRGHASWSRSFGAMFRARAGLSWAETDYEVADFAYNTTVTCGFLGAFEKCFYLREQTRETGVWSDIEWAAKETVDITFGVRWTDFAYQDNEAETIPFAPGRVIWLDYDLPQGNRVLPRAAITWKPTTSWSTRFTLGAGYRQGAPTFSEVCCGRRYRSNRGIEMEESVALGAEVAWQPRPELKIGGSVSMTDFDDLVVKLVSISAGWVPTYQNVNVPEARYTSLSLEARGDVAEWVTLRGNASWTRAENRTPGGRIPVIADPGGVPLLFDLFSDRIPYLPVNTASVGAVFRPSRGATLDLSIRHQGSMLIQELAEAQVSPTFRGTPAFETMNIRFDQVLSRGITLYAGADNIRDYVDSTLGNKVFDYDWGPLRGRYVYAGLAYRFSR